MQPFNVSRAKASLSIIKHLISTVNIFFQYKVSVSTGQEQCDSAFNRSNLRLEISKIQVSVRWLSRCGQDRKQFSISALFFVNHRNIYPDTSYRKVVCKLYRVPESSIHNYDLATQSEWIAIWSNRKFYFENSLLFHISK